MKTVIVHKTPVDLEEYVQRSAAEVDIKQLVSEPSIIIDGDTDEVLAIYADLPQDPAKLTHTLQAIKYDTSERTAGLKTTSRIFGYNPRNTLRKDYCSATGLATDAPELHAVILEWGKYVAEVYKSFLPERAKAHYELLEEKVIDEYRIEGTPFTSGIINKNNPLKYHFDSGNFRGVYSCMITIKRDIGGGYLAMPEYGIGLELKNNTVAMFDGQSLLHGVTPIEKQAHDAYRFTVVYYSLLQMWKCLPLTEEIARIRKVRMEREARRARVMRGLEEEHPAVLATKRQGEKQRAKKK